MTDEAPLVFDDEPIVMPDCTPRERLAGEALVGLMVQGECDNAKPHRIIQTAFHIADIVLREQGE